LLSLLLAHAAAVTRDADRLGLVSERDSDAVVARHTADSLLFALARAPEEGESWIDVGSGAGFPGVVLACCFPGAQFVVLEPQRRRAGFLELQVADLGLQNTEVICARAADMTPAYDVAIARALAEPLLALETLKALIRPGGAVMLAVGDSVAAPPEVEDLDVGRPGVDSPGRLFMIAQSLGEA